MANIVLASGNRGKVREFNQLLQPRGYQVIPQTDLGVSEALESGLSFVENAIIKARNASAQTGEAALADDSGLEVDFLGNSPGIYSARYAGEGASDSDNVAKLLRELEGVIDLSERSARFQCVLVFLKHEHDPTPIICQESWEGSITLQPQGENGFGYDPIFWVEQYQCTAAELSPEQKNRLSHRGRAMQQLLQKLPLAEA
ncbi:RdgB/HAM1 family non-canonical purine NTP pyrophosphatase [Ectothiorhodospiraceae bacterium BW-2]|nr:RdgB/HAM1 family non-canonical purine NTP pyrophosphatase [Ectothiorhodospiraceae bacterium BW-2]